MRAAAGEQPVTRVSQAMRDAAMSLAATSDTARLDAEVLMAHALGASRSDLLLRRMGDECPTGFAMLVERRARHEPVAYITGMQEFYGLPFQVTPAVLIPRSDSEVLIEQALATHAHAERVLDCGTGSGALLLACLANMPQAIGVGIDRSAAALRVAAGNAIALGLANRARIVPGDWTQAGWSEGLPRFDVILANPPYVELAADLAPSVRAFEPAEALFAGDDGLDNYRCLIPQLPDLLVAGGIALVEIGATQAAAVMAIGVDCGFEASLHLDLGQRARAVRLTRRP